MNGPHLILLLSRFFLHFFSLSASSFDGHNFSYSEPIFDRPAVSDSLGHSLSYLFYEFFSKGSFRGRNLRFSKGSQFWSPKNRPYIGKLATRKNWLQNSCSQFSGYKLAAHGL